MIHVQMLQDAGFRAARTVELLSFELPHAVHGIAVIPTTVQAYPHHAAGYLRNTAARFKFAGAWNLLHWTSIWPAFAEVLLARAAAAGGVFHLWGHSWEIEETGQWEALDRILAAMAQYKACASFMTNMELCSDVGKSNSSPRPTLMS
jgi:peptidoglycan-N-acetylglucosamine deacetylase